MSCYINRMFLFAFFFGGIISTALSQKTPIAGLSNQITAKSDWLVTPINQKAQVIEDGDNITLDNGLVKRGFRISPNAACTDYINLTNGQQLLRAVKPEAKIVLDGKEYN